jgi:hypothetical protein
MKYKLETVLAVEKTFPFYFKRKDMYQYFRNSKYKMSTFSYTIRSNKTLLVCMWL